MKNLDSINVKGKRVLLRVDLNSSVSGNKVIENPRFREHSKTIKELKRKGAIVVILAHQGRPGKKDFVSLKGHARILNKYVKVKFVDDVVGRKASMEIEKLKSGEVLLLDNIRKLKEELDGKKGKFIDKYKDKFDYYVNDAFSVMHRKQASIVVFPKHFSSVIGRVAENEIKNLERVKKNLKGSVFVLGGNKPKDVILLINKNKVLTTGTLSLLTLMARGYKLGKQEKSLKEDKKHVSEIRKYLRGKKTPIDLAINYRGKRKEIDLNDLPVNDLILDIGKETVKDYVKEIKKAKAIFFKGSAGMIEDDKFSFGTRELLKAISKARGFSVIAGGSSSTAIDSFRISRKGFGHVSLSGGALVYYLSGRKLVGLEVLG